MNKKLLEIIIFMLKEEIETIKEEVLFKQDLLNALLKEAQIETNCISRYRNDRTKPQ